jgi:hypothetical protein
VAKFADLSVNLPGTYTFKFTDGSLTGAITATATVVPIPVTERYTFNGLGLSSQLLVQQQERNAIVFTISGPPTSAQVNQAVNAENNEPLLSNEEIVTGSFAAAPISPAVVSGASAFAASGSTVTDDTGSDSQLLDTVSGGSDSKLLN